MSIRYENNKHRITCSRSHRLQASAHLHSHIEIVYLLDGSSSAWVDDTEYPLTRGDIFIAFPNQVHRYTTTEYEDAWVILFDEEICSEFNPWFINCVPVSNVLHSGEYDADKVNCFIPMIRELYGKELSEINAIELKGLALSFMAAVFAGLKFTEEKMAEVSVMKQMLNFCAANYTEELSLERLEKELHINRFYISHLFSQKLKIKFNDYVNNLRVSHACKLLRQTDMNMTDIVSASGFATSRTFNRAFLKIMGEAPNKYRQKWRNS